jgi:acyl-coenzyme A thioesterase PaaI-like protein
MDASSLGLVADSYFQVLDEDATGGRYVAHESTSGPWDPRLQHGGPPSALSVRGAARAAAAAAERPDLVAVRFSAEFVGPVPVGELRVESDVLRVARSAVLVATTLIAGDRTCLSARTWFVRDADTSDIAHPTLAREPAAELPGLGGTFPYADSIEWRSELGGISSPGPGVVWARPRQALVEGEPLAGLERAVLVGDSASGISSELDWDLWSFVNVDLDIHLARPLSGAWVLIEARTQLGGHGSALCRSTLSDVRGEVGCTAATLVLAPR